MQFQIFIYTTECSFIYYLTTFVKQIIILKTFAPFIRLLRYMVPHYVDAFFRLLMNLKLR